MSADANSLSDTLTPPGDSRAAQVMLWLVMAFGISFAVLQRTVEEQGGASSLGFLDLLLLAALAGGLLARRFGWLGLPRWVDSDKAPYVYAFLVWLTGMLYEMSLRTGETGFGGLHPDTVSSFILAQGFYIPFAVAILWVIRRRWLPATAVFWLGASVSWYEVMTVGIPGIFATPQNFILAPLVLGYYLASYALFAALPLVVMDVEALWGETDRPYTWATIVGHGFLIGLVSWAVFALWSLVLSPVLAG